MLFRSVGRTAQLAPFGTKVGPVAGGDASDDQGFKIGSMGRGVAKSRGQQIRHFGVSVRMDIPVAGMLTERPCLQGVRDAPSKRQRPCGVADRRAFLQRRYQTRAGIGVKFLWNSKLRQLLLESAAIARTVRPGLGCFDQTAPFIRPCTRTGEKLIDPAILNLVC